MNWKSAIALAFAACTPGVLAAFAIVTVSTSSGDITSLKYNNIECQDSSKYTHIGSGLGSATVSYKISGNYATITIATSTLTQYYVAVSGQSAIYIGTYTTAEPSVGELRFIARLSKSALPKGGTAIEGSDVYSLNGQTRSKFFSSVQFIKDQVHGVTGNGVGVYMDLSSAISITKVIRDLLEAITTLTNSRIFPAGTLLVFRTGFFGPYAMVFTSGNAPSASLDTSFFANLGIKGYVAASGRGTVKGTVSGVPSGFTAVVGLDNSAAQYWGTVSGTSYTINGVKPGTYKATLYKKELEVGTGSVTVSAGGTATLNLASTESIKSNIWQIGLPDGTPSGFLTDSRMSGWGPVTYTIGSSSPSSFPMAQFVAVNNPTTIKWTATSSQIGARTLRIRTTSSFAGGRPAIKVNNWSSANPAAPTKIDSRGVTRGTWRGGSSGDAFLSPNVVYDSVELY
ncbi:polysaccharide lyase family 4 protein [Rhizoctonia solani AG-1 IA]|uniref:rhamnogalacturonan endolyase n=1 Tax=Thanatephorus cucumeris (strain AG1-IA) TaxID=983506 RepID=L8WS75_THACA|nr:polysaccharide lyase family 4 protein [Rhizoctonia solani AG-1 IA]